jgi:hypothetical protein
MSTDRHITGRHVSVNLTATGTQFKERSQLRGWKSQYPWRIEPPPLYIGPGLAKILTVFRTGIAAGGGNHSTAARYPQADTTGRRRVR